LESQPEKIILQGIYVHCGKKKNFFEKVEDLKKNLFEKVEDLKKLFLVKEIQLNLVRTNLVPTNLRLNNVFSPFFQSLIHV
jgi:hypothetical protein